MKRPSERSKGLIVSFVAPSRAGMALAVITQISAAGRVIGLEPLHAVGRCVATRGAAFVVRGRRSIVIRCRECAADRQAGGEADPGAIPRSVAVAAPAITTPSTAAPAVAAAAPATTAT